MQKGDDAIPTAYPENELETWAGRAREWASGGVPADLPLADPSRKVEYQPRDVFVYFIHEGKIRAPQAAMEFARRAQS